MDTINIDALPVRAAHDAVSHNDRKFSLAFDEFEYPW